MTKHVIDDAMVRRCKDALEIFDGTSESVRRILHAALNPPPEPEVVVTQEQRVAGERVCKDEWHLTDHTFADCAENIYRAMRKLEPKFGASIMTRADIVAEQAKANEKLRRELDVAWTNLHHPFTFPWYNRMAGPHAVIPTTDPRVKQRRVSESGWYKQPWKERGDFGRSGAIAGRRSTDR